MIFPGNFDAVSVFFFSLELMWAECGGWVGWRGRSEGRSGGKKERREGGKGYLFDDSAMIIC